MASAKSTDIGVRFGLRLRALRESRGLSLMQMSVYSGLSKSFLHDLEQAKSEPGLRTLQVLARCFERSISQLLRGL
jgi:transcriptional regulator with XRE-family HTH domain